jgi:formylglycine-generating enzyme required for sulfatase activity
MIETICALVLSGASLAYPTLCSADPASPDQIVATITPPLKLPTKRDPRHARPSPAKMNMVTVQPGRGIIGSSLNELKRQRFEGPQTEFSIPYRFEVGKFEVTFDDWNNCLAGGGCKGYRPKDKGWGQGRRPVTNVSYNDVQSYIRWLNRSTGLRYRLLSEAEWEYVAKAGGDGPFATGAAISAQDANFDGAHPYGVNKPGRYLRKTLPVGSYPANALGLHDLHGNVYEWVADCWNETHKDRPKTARARRDGDCNFRVMKGGSWVTHGYQMRAAARIRYVKDYRYDDYGFRLARTLE